MTLQDIARRFTPEPVKCALRPVRDRMRTKNDAELSYWRGKHSDEGGRFSNGYYRNLMLAIAGEDGEEFLEGRVVADLGCGPRGSLQWASAASLRVGIDVLADRYAEAFAADIVSHGMVYVKSTERVIPVPSDSIDVLFTVNAMDHVDDFSAMCGEIVRILRPGGLFVGSFNLEEPASRCEPQRLDEDRIREGLLCALEVESYRVSAKGPAGNQYAPLYAGGELSYEPGQEGYLWVRARKPV